MHLLEDCVKAKCSDRNQSIAHLGLSSILGLTTYTQSALDIKPRICHCQRSLGDPAESRIDNWIYILFLVSE